MRLVVPPDPLTVPTWLTAIFTRVLAIGAIVTAIFAIRAFRKQSTEVTLLQAQAEEQEKAARRDAAERRWQQATLVYMTRQLLPGVRADPAAIAADVYNTSAQPVYDVRIHWGGRRQILAGRGRGPARNCRAGMGRASPAGRADWDHR
jgi:hypothetical protein